MSAEKLGPRFAGADGTPAAKSSGKLEKIKVPTAAEAQAKREAKEREKAAKKERERQRNERWREKEREKLKKKSEKEAELAKKAEERLKRATPEGIKKAATENWLDRAGELIEQHEQETRGRGEMSIDLQLSDAERLNELAAEINAAHGEVIEGALRSLGHAFRVGELLIKARKLIEQQHGSSYGHWMPWVKQHCAFSHSTSEDYVWVAEHRAEIEAKMGAAANSEHAPNFTIRGARRLLAPPKQEIIPPEPDASPDMPAPEAPKDGDAAPTAPTPQRRRCKPPKAPDFVPASGKPAKAPDFVPGPVTEDDSTDSGNLRDLFDRIVAIIPEELAADLSAELWEWMDLPFPSGRLVDGAAETIAHTFEAALVSRYPHRNLHTGVMGYAEAPEDEPAPDREQHSERKPESDSKQADSKKNDPEESDAEAAA